jgi:hypothetical protein
MTDVFERILIVTHDAGGAEVLAAVMIAEQARYNFRVATQSGTPAEAIMRRHGIDKQVSLIDDTNNISKQLASLVPDVLIAGTGWTGYENEWIQAAKAVKIPTVAVLEHWTSYNIRFGAKMSKDWRKNLPNLIAVTDNHGWRLAEEAGLKPLARLRNYYLHDLATRFGRRPTTAGNGTLLILSECHSEFCERTYGQADHFGFTEVQAFDDLLREWQTLSEQWKLQKVVIRLHPADTEAKYDHLAVRYPHVPLVIEPPNTGELLTTLHRAQVVIGLNTMALVVARVMKIPVLSYVPRGDASALVLCGVPRVRSIAELLKTDIYSAPKDEAQSLDLFSEYTLENLLVDLKGITA